MAEKTTLKVQTLSEEDMRALRFTDFTPESWYYTRSLGSTITFNLSVDKVTRKDGQHKFVIDVLDEDFLQPYDYQYMLVKDPNFKFALDIKERVEEQMQLLQDAGIIEGFVRGMYI